MHQIDPTELNYALCNALAWQGMNPVRLRVLILQAMCLVGYRLYRILKSICDIAMRLARH